MTEMGLFSTKRSNTVPSIAASLSTRFEKAYSVQHQPTFTGLDLLDLCEKDQAISEVMQRYSATRETLKELFHKLIVTGGAQWAGNHYVAASSLVYPHTLEFLLRYFRGIDAIDDTYQWSIDLTSSTPGRAVAMRVTYELIRYFEDGRTGPVEQDV
jgi:hypothetical protein